MKFARQLLSKAISQESIDNSPSNYLKEHIFSFAKSIGSINASTSKKIDVAQRISQYESAFRVYYDNDLIRSLCAGKDSSFSPIIDVDGNVFKQSQSTISALPERFELKIVEPELDEVSRNTFPDETDVKLATYEFQNIVYFTDDFEKSLQALKATLNNNFNEDNDIRINFLSSSRVANQYVVDFKVKTLKNQLEADCQDFKKFLLRYSFELIGIRTIRKHSNKNNKAGLKIRPKALVIFIDSLDKRIFQDQNLLDSLPNLSKLSKCSDYFHNFISSGDWTYPVLHSIFYGISPALSFSIFRTYTPNFYSKNHPNIFSDASSFITYIQSIQPKIFTRMSPEGHLFNKLKQHNIDTYSIRQSSNLSWLYSLTAQGSVTLERNQFAAKGLKALAAKDDLTDHLLWIDLDDLHRLDMPLSNTSLGRADADYKFTCPSSSIDKLYSRTNSSDMQIYIEKLSALDLKIGEIINLVDDNVPIVVFSDHGSKAYSSDSDTKCGTLSPSRIHNPTLLVSYTRTSNKNTISSIIESQDLHQLLLNLCGVKSISHSALDFQIPDLYSYFNSNSNSYQDFVESINSRRFAITMGSSVTEKNDMNLECVLSRYIDGSIVDTNVKTSFSSLIETVKKSENSNSNTCRLFYKHWVRNGVKALIKTALE